MDDAPQGFPTRIVRHGRSLRFFAVAHHVDDDAQAVVLCKDDADGSLLFLPQEEWPSSAAQDPAAHQSDAKPLSSSADSAISEPAQPETRIVTSASPTADKVALFRSLFQGRRDVYAHGYRRKDGGIGYAPACANEYARGICPKCTGARIECGRCDRRAFRELTDRVSSNPIW